MGLFSSQISIVRRLRGSTIHFLGKVPRLAQMSCKQVHRAHFLARFQKIMLSRGSHLKNQHGRSFPDGLFVYRPICIQFGRHIQTVFAPEIFSAFLYILSNYKCSSFLRKFLTRYTYKRSVHFYIVCFYTLSIDIK